MKKIMIPSLFVFSLIIVGCNGKGTTDTSKATVEQLQARIAELEAEVKNNDANLARFDFVDFESWNKKDLVLFNKLHDKDIIVYNPDGSKQTAKEHSDWAKHAFTTGESYAQVKSHPIKVASKDWTAVIGINAIPQADGSIKEVPMSTFSKWKDGKMIEEHLFFGSAK